MTANREAIAARLAAEINFKAHKFLSESHWETLVKSGLVSFDEKLAAELILAALSDADKQEQPSATRMVSVPERWVVAVNEFLSDWQKGDFKLPELAEIDAKEILATAAHPISSVVAAPAKECAWGKAGYPCNCPPAAPQSAQPTQQPEMSNPIPRWVSDALQAKLRRRTNDGCK
jgi:hypothetical protein